MGWAGRVHTGPERVEVVLVMLVWLLNWVSVPGPGPTGHGSPSGMAEARQGLRKGSRGEARGGRASQA